MRRGSMSRTRFGLKDFITKRGDLVYHQDGNYVRKTHHPYSFRVGSHSRTRRNTTSKLRNLVYH